MAEEIIEVEADSLEEAREQIKPLIPEGFHLLSEQIIWDGKPQTVQVSADTMEAAFAKAQTLVPVGAKILERKELAAPEQKMITVEANDEYGIEMSAKRTYQIRGASFRNIRLITPGSKGFLGVGKKPNRYQVEVLQPAIVSIAYRTKAKISVKVGEKKEESKTSHRVMDSVECARCGKNVIIKSPNQGAKGKILVATPASMRDVAFRCRFCDFITCMECALRAYELHDPRQGIPTCPSCGQVAGPIFFTEWLDLKNAPTPTSSKLLQRSKQPIPEANEDALFLQAEPISRKRMDLLWLELPALEQLEQSLTENKVVSIQMGESLSLRGHQFTQVDLQWAKEIVQIATRGHSEGQLGRYRDAIRYYKEALQLAPGCDLFLMSIGSCYAYLGQKEKGLRYLERAVQISPDNTRIQGNLASVSRGV